MSVVAEVVAAALAEDIGLLGDLTTIALHPRRPDRDRVVRRPRGGRARRHRARRGDLPAGRRPDRGRSGSFATATRSSAGAEIGEVSGSLRSILTGERVALNFLCHCSGVATLDAPLRARRARQGAHPRHAQDAARPARGAARGGARRRRLQPPRLAVDRGADQGQPPRRARAHQGRRARPGALADAAHRGRVRHARPGGRSARRRASTSCCSTT